MDSTKIEQLIKSLGKTHQELIESNVIPDGELIELFPDIDELCYEPAIGIEMGFWWGSERFEKLHITFLKSTPSTIEYIGELPSPYSLKMNQALVHELFGSSNQFSGPIKMPEPMGQTGGWESYNLDQSLYPNIKVVFKYLNTMEVKGITFTLIEKDHEYP